MKSQVTNTRITWIDMAKGYGTILVIYAHLGVGELWTWIYSFHLPLFFFLSGYVFSTKYDFKEFLIRKIKAIIVPYFCYGTIMIAFVLLWNKFIYGTSFGFGDIIYYIKLLLRQQRFWTLWFMACLFFLNIGFYLLVKLNKQNFFIAYVSILLPIIGLYYYKSGGTALYWNIDTCLMAIPFFTCGYLCKQHIEKIETVLTQKKTSICLFVAFALLNIISWKLSLDETGLGLEMFDSNYGNPLFTYIAAFSGIFCVIILSKNFTFKPIQYIGENSMIYYTLHQTIMIPLVSKILSLMGITKLMSSNAIYFIVYKWIWLIGIIILLTGCSFIIGMIKSLNLQKKNNVYPN